MFNLCLPVYVAGPKELEVAEEVLPVAGGVHPTPGKENDQMILSQNDINYKKTFQSKPDGLLHIPLAGGDVLGVPAPVEAEASYAIAGAGAVRACGAQENFFKADNVNG